jgi:thiol:disulfide interchange protein DsbC
MLRSLALATSLALAAFSAHAAPDMAKIQETVKQINENAKIAWVKDSPIKGLNEVGVDGVVLYISDDGRYLIHGTFLDVVTRKNLTEIAGADVRKDLLASIKDSDKIIYRPKGAVKHKIIVFTDISCGYCSKVHENLQGYLDRGIQVEYVAFPRGGTQSPVTAQMEAIWCAADRNAAYDAAIKGKVLSGNGCKNPVAASYELGDKLGIQGTPAIYTMDGMQHGGYVSPEQLAADLSAKRAPGEPEKESASTTQGGSAVARSN